MPIKYALFRNHLTTDPDDFTAHVQITATVGPEELAKRIIDQGSTTTSADILAVLEDVAKAIEACLEEGMSVNIPGIANLRASIKGPFTGPKDKFDPSRNTVDVGASPGKRIRKYIRENAKVEKDDAIKPAPELLEFVDRTTGAVNDTVRANALSRIDGSLLKYDPTQPDEGIYFVQPEGGPETKVTVIDTNTATQLVFATPSDIVIANEYILEVRARISGGTELRVGRLDGMLTGA